MREGESGVDQHWLNVNPRSKYEKKCSDCGCGIIGNHMKRHKGSKVCLKRQQELKLSKKEPDTG